MWIHRAQINCWCFAGLVLLVLGEGFLGQSVGMDLG